MYSMRQAIEEGFILDVLTQYTTFDVYWRVRQTSGSDPEVAKAKASSQIGKTVSLHAHNLAQRAKIIVDHYREHVRPEIGGRAKAMIVTASRLHAVRYKQAIDRYLADEHITDTRALVAFSGTVTDPDDPDNGFTEAGMNKHPESETAARFKGEDGFDPDGYQVLIVAEKYQTGFDAPLLLAMYVDKKLEGVNAVQTLARLNRTHPGKPLPFVLDFRNDAEAIAEAFRPWYDTTISEPVDANTLYTFQGNLQSAGVFNTAEVDHYWTVFADTAPNDRKGNGALYAALEAPLARFTDDLDDDTREQFRSDLDAYLRGYSFLSQIATWTDPELEKLYVFAKSLKAVLPRRPNDGAMDLGSEVELTHLRIEKQGEFDTSLAGETGDAGPARPVPRWRIHRYRRSREGPALRHRQPAQREARPQPLAHRRPALRAVQGRLDRRPRDPGGGEGQRPRQLHDRLRQEVHERRPAAHGRQRRHLQGDPRRRRLRQGPPEQLRPGRVPGTTA